MISARGKGGVLGGVVIGRVFVGRHSEMVPKKAVLDEDRSSCLYFFLHKLGTQLIYLAVLSAVELWS